MTITARPMVKSDARIRADIMSEIEWDPFIRDVPCKVTVENGAVTVTGQAPSLAARVSVIEAAHRVQGVLDDLVAALDPVWCEVTGAFGVRGGIGITVRAEHGRKPA